MIVTKPFFRRNWFIILISGVILATIGFAMLVDAIVVLNGPFNNNCYGYAIGGSFPFGMGIGYIICSGIIRQLEKKLTS
jgi:hypothetical protein